MVGKQERRYQRMITVVLALISLIMVIPLVLLVVASFTSNNEIVLHGYSFFPKELSLEAYRYIWNERAQVFHAYGITILVTAIGTTIGVMMTLLYAYVPVSYTHLFDGHQYLARIYSAENGYIGAAFSLERIVSGFVGERKDLCVEVRDKMCIRDRYCGKVFSGFIWSSAICQQK